MFLCVFGPCFFMQYLQGGQSRGQHDWVHGFAEPVKLFITFVLLSQILCVKVQKNPHIFLLKTVGFVVVSQITLNNYRKKNGNSLRLSTHFCCSR